jgi:MFS family permease
MTNNFEFLKRREILILGFSSIVSGLGNWITMMAILSLIIFQGDGGVAESSGIFLAGLLPIMLASPLAGKLADRYDRKKLMIVSEVGSGATIAIIIFTDSLWLIYLAMALQAVFVALMNPARQSALPQLVHDPAELERVNAFFQQLNSILKIVAPMVAGFLLTIMNAHQAIIVDIISFAISAVILMQLPRLLPVGGGPVSEAVRAGSYSDGHTSTEIGEPVPEAVWAGLKPAPTNKNEALTFLKDSRALRLLFISSFLSILIIVGFDILGSVYIRDVLHGDESFLGIMLSLLGVGSLITTVLVVVRKSKNRNWQDLALGVFLLAVLPLCMALGYMIQNPVLVRVLVVAAGFIGGIGNGFLMIQLSTILQITSPAEILGRLSGYFEFTLIGGQLFSVVMLPLLIPTVIDPMTYFLGSTVALWVVAGLIARQSGRFAMKKSDKALDMNSPAEVI